MPSLSRSRSWIAVGVSVSAILTSSWAQAQTPPPTPVVGTLQSVGTGRPAQPTTPLSPFQGGNSPLSPFFQPIQGRNGNGSRTTEDEMRSYTTPLSPFRLYNPSPARRSPYRYRNGLLGNGTNYYYQWGQVYFPSGFASYPYYAPAFMPSFSCYSPYAFYYGGAAPFIQMGYVYQAPPAVIYVPVPVYSERGEHRGWRREDIDDYYLNSKAPNAESKTKKEKEQNRPSESGEGDEAPAKPKKAEETPIEKASKELRSAWLERDIQKIAGYVDSKTRIAVYLRGKYQYSLNPKDYLDLTRDAFQSAQTVQFALDPPQKKERGVYLLTGKHHYQGRDGEIRTVFVNYVLEEREGKLVLTQVGSAPEKLERPTPRPNQQLQPDEFQVRE